MSKRRVPIATVFALVSALFFNIDSHAAPPDESNISISLKPEAPKAGKIDVLDVAIQSSVGVVPAGAPLVRLPLITANVTTSAVALKKLEARDDLGPLALTSRDDSAGREPYRHWVAGRLVRGRLQLTYEVAIDDAPNARGAAPPFELRTEDGAFSGLLGAFAILPDSDRPYSLDLHWDFSNVAPGAIGVSTLGLGDASSPGLSSPADLETNFVMGGAVGREPTLPAADGFFSAWQGSPPFDAHALMQWTHQLPWVAGVARPQESGDVGAFGDARSPEAQSETIAARSVQVVVGLTDHSDVG